MTIYFVYIWTRIYALPFTVPLSGYISCALSMYGLGYMHSPSLLTCTSPTWFNHQLGWTRHPWCDYVIAIVKKILNCYYSLTDESEMNWIVWVSQAFHLWLFTCSLCTMFDSSLPVPQVGISGLNNSQSRTWYELHSGVPQCLIILWCGPHW